MITTFIGVDSYYFSPKRIHIRYQNIQSSQVPSSLNNLSIALISDVEYGTFLQKNQVAKIQKKIRNLQPDIILFSGDLFDQGYTPTEEDIDLLTDFLNTLDAPYGKFAVYGEMDQDHLTAVEKILSDSNFEVIENQVIQIRKQQQDYLYLIGLPNVLQQEPDTTLFADISEDAYVIVLCHTPDVIEYMPIGQVDLLLSAHSHASQYSLPFYGPLHSITGNQSYHNGSQYIDSIQLYISGGIGTTQRNIRLFSDPVIPVIRFHSK
ncbi:MAG: metallophosphoesterase [Erysipelotrichaceae bacterium]|nr:metallophosphoesterase [Erysipelotrichaceae bacterium]